VRLLNGTIQVDLDEKTHLFLFPAERETLKKFRHLRDGKITQIWFKGGASR